MHCIEIIPETSISACTGALEWFLMEYLSDHGLDLIVEHKDLSNEGVTGWCLKTGEGEFTIQIHQDLTGDEYTKTLLHELYHVYQHLNGMPQCEMCAYMSEDQNLDKLVNH